MRQCSKVAPATIISSSNIYRLLMAYIPPIQGCNVKPVRGWCVAVGVQERSLWHGRAYATHQRQYDRLKQLIAIGLCREDIEEVDEVTGDTPLLRAAMAGDANGLRLLLSAGASIRARNKEGWSCFHSVSYGGSGEAARVLCLASDMVDALHAKDRVGVPQACPLPSGLSLLQESSLSTFVPHTIRTSKTCQFWPKN